ncbi:MAG: helix-turn-helix transcriptional regulator [Bacillota bacterium]|jgi:DNA-binding CsgD family transcriptional regulator
MSDGSLPLRAQEPRAGFVSAVVSRRWPHLTSRELAVLEQLSQGRSTDEMSAALFLSRSTVKFHVGNLLKKTGSRSTRHLLSMVIALLATEAAAARSQADPGRLGRPPPP